MVTSTPLPPPPGPVAEDAYRDLRARLEAFIARRVESRETAEDLAQEVLLRLLRADTAHLANPSAWLFRVARNVITDHYRTRRPAAPISVDRTRPADSAADPFADDPASARRELATCLVSLVDQLAEPYRSAVTAVDLHGHTHAAMAGRAGISIPGAKSRVQRGRRLLRRLLTDCCAVQTSASGTVIDYQSRRRCAVDSSGQRTECS
jgi:RNA polymerase sigma-70 factor, ECF subfamily